jgi:anti-sigma regulatory factor (Ser/Thr protein kinase)
MRSITKDSGLGGTFQAQIPGMMQAVAPMRRMIARYAEARGFLGEDLHDIESAVGEALANAVEHGSLDGSLVAVRAAFRDRDLVVEIHDNGTGFAGWQTPARLRPMPQAVRGHGIFIMLQLMDEVVYADGGRCVRLIKRARVPIDHTLRTQA